MNKCGRRTFQVLTWNDGQKVRENLGYTVHPVHWMLTNDSQAIKSGIFTPFRKRKCYDIKYKLFNCWMSKSYSQAMKCGIFQPTKKPRRSMLNLKIRTI